MTPPAIGGRSCAQSRREFLAAGAAVAAASLWGRNGRTPTAADSAHPRLYLRADPAPGLLSIADVRGLLQAPPTSEIWERIRHEARRDLSAPLLLPSSVFEGRNLSAARHSNADWSVCNAVGQRLQRAALMSLLSGQREYAAMALRQMEALFDEQQWPAWMDQAHERFGHPADLRTGMLAHDVALSYDWMHGLLSAAERSAVLDGLTRRGIRPYLESLAQDPWWTHELNNWLTVIVGGFGIAGMALDGDHPQARTLVETALPQMQRYLSIYGADGEFNESVAYANATKLPVGFFLAYQYWRRDSRSILASHPFPATCRWLMYNTLPPGRVAAFGDAGTEARPEVKYVAAVAAATGDQILQWFYRTHAGSSADALELLWHDARLEALSPEGKLPRARFYHAHGATVSSRADWNPTTTASVVYGKAGREENHEHNDIGQLCIDGEGERLILDLGSPSAYPADFFEAERWNYYNASTRGHNIVMIGGRELRTRALKRGSKASLQEQGWSGRYLQTWQDDTLGASWVIDASAAYEGAERVRRHVLHLLPSVVAILDEVRLARSDEISLRWHTADRSEPDSHGRFLVRANRAWAAARVMSLGREPLHIRRAEHSYESPFDRDRLGEPLQKRHESYVEAQLRSSSCRLLSLFAIGRADEEPRSWTEAGRGWSFTGTSGTTEVVLTAEKFLARNAASGAEVSILL